jgi:hypothetical protein
VKLVFRRSLYIIALFLFLAQPVYAVEEEITVTYRPTISTDETVRHCNSVGCGVLAFLTGAVQAGETSSSTFDRRSHITFRDVEVCQGCTIVSSTLTLRGSSFSGTGGTRITHLYGDDRNSAVPPTTATGFDAIAKTTATVNWTLDTATWNSATHTSPDIKTIIQEIVNRSGWESGNDMGIFWGDFTDGFSSSRQFTATATVGSGNEPLLTITFTQDIRPEDRFQGIIDFLGRGMLIFLSGLVVFIIGVVTKLDLIGYGILSLLASIFLWIVGAIANVVVLTVLVLFAGYIIMNIILSGKSSEDRI